MKNIKKLLTFSILASTLVFLTSCGKSTGAYQPAGDPKSEDEKIGYSMGVFFAKQLKVQNENLHLEQFLSGFKAGYTGEKVFFTDEQVKENLDLMVKKLQEEAVAKAEAASKKNTEDAKKFFEENAKVEGVVTDESGLQYKVVKEGKGENPKVEDLVTVDYEGKLLNGEVFDSSFERGEPAKFKLNQVIKGWQLGLQKMKVGAEYLLYIPADLAYGEIGAGDKIGPNAALIFKVNLISIGEEKQAKSKEKDAKSKVKTDAKK